ncbi:Hypothetical_protein [Hexamita inflata]|uniref:Hypothetical_protein n=1 Tax=Hexamita inflata TaxID=28002 RepID=A0AA86RNS0_9EUKA|nr:Hypothetical protein HINF_LOCUS65572 [Hexamita inflata]CAI9977931.1 Hypothetical protein HINF_LOCUS65576 [Hexamita inflata]
MNDINTTGIITPTIDKANEVLYAFMSDFWCKNMQLSLKQLIVWCFLSSDPQTRIVLLFARQQYVTTDPSIQSNKQVDCGWWQALSNFMFATFVRTSACNVSLYSTFIQSQEVSTLFGRNQLDVTKTSKEKNRPTENTIMIIAVQVIYIFKAFA